MKVTKWSINSGELHVSEPSEQTEDAPKAGMSAAVPDDAGKIESPPIAPDHEAPKADAPKVELPKVEANKPGTPGTAGKMLIMSPGDRAWRGEDGTKAAAEHAPAARRFGAMAAVVALATIAGAAGGALATMGMMQTTETVAAAPAGGALEAAIARIDADMQQLKNGLDHTSKTALTQFNKTSDRLDRIEKAQAEPNARLAKLSETVEKLRTAPAAAVVAATSAASREVTGSVTPPAVAAVAPAPAAQVAAAPVPAAPPKPEVGRLPTVDGWTLTDVGYGGALIRNSRGTWEVYAGDRIPGLGRIDAIRKQDGRWVVVTERGLIVARQ